MFGSPWAIENHEPALFVINWNMYGALVRPNAITRNSKWPWWVPNAILVSSSSCIAVAQIDFGEEACALEVVQQFIHHRDRELVLNSVQVEGASVEDPALRTNKTGSKNGDVLDLMTLSWSISSHCF